jgi:preprotein translocase subunit SecE
LQLRNGGIEAERVKAQAMSGEAPESRAGALWARIKAYPQRFGAFLHDVRMEMRQVTWPSRQDVVSTTAVVIVAVAFFAVYFFGVDSTVGYLVQYMLGAFGN